MPITPEPSASDLDSRDNASLEAGVSETDATVVTPLSSITPEQYPAGITSRELAHALRGEVLGHFLLQEFIGGGGMGVVFKAHDTRLERTVAVKVLASQRLSGEDLQKRFEVEALSAARLDHPNIARVYEAGVERGLPYIVFEYIEGANVRDVVVDHGPLPLGDALHTTYQAALALTHAHERDVIHRDIKPSNILLTAAGDAKLIDMGLARLTQNREDHELTATGMTLGTFDYVSPEQAQDPRDADVRSDIYSLGCTLFFMLTGQAPFGRGTAVQKLMQHQNDPAPDVRLFRSDVPEAVSDLIQSMLEKSPAHRPQTPAELAAILGGMLQELGVSFTPPATPLILPAESAYGAVGQQWTPWALAAMVMIASLFVIDRALQIDTPPAEFRPLRMLPANLSAADAEPARETTSEPASEPPAVAAQRLQRTAADRLAIGAVGGAGRGPQSTRPTDPGVQIDFGATAWPFLLHFPRDLQAAPPPEPAVDRDATPTSDESPIELPVEFGTAGPFPPSTDVESSPDASPADGSQQIPDSNRPAREDDPLDLRR